MLTGHGQVLKVTSYRHDGRARLTAPIQDDAATWRQQRRSLPLLLRLRAASGGLVNFNSGQWGGLGRACELGSVGTCERSRPQLFQELAWLSAAMRTGGSGRNSAAASRTNRSLARAARVSESVRLSVRVSTRAGACGRERERESVCVCVCARARARARARASGRARAWAGGRASDHACAFMCTCLASTPYCARARVRA